MPEIKPSTNAEAIDIGAPRYFTGKPCSRGHVADRHVPEGDCVECRKMNRREQMKRRRERYHSARLANADTA